MTVSKIYEAIDPVSDFDFLLVLAKNDPEAFERIRNKIIQEFIHSNDAVKHEQLMRFQWRIDQTRQQANNPLHALMKINQMMWDSLDNLSVVQQHLLGHMNGQESKINPDFEVVDLNEFKKRQANKKM